ncbi:short-chain dehydrogenase [Flavobacteriaceae bacterium S0825]|uniref:YqaA family protein n=1 Tax=Gaetbulibacter sp. S0825 TaxID=2720084 RepID=UPI00142F6B4D|nr:short-chain dehydrogenase [Gaetbulibacter sp. S0825]MCK0109783.1 short-chain dehydrogenase [Flavobacteriaceae bacterium S0825]NIX65415.1 short-chain dehydrogenase [Gaetbulibacter sp. S0825]
MDSNTKTKKSRFRLLHQYYSYTGFYRFIGLSLKKSIIPVVLFIGVLLGIHYFVIDINTALTTITETFSTVSVLVVFFLSESMLGLIPPEIFIAWSKKLPQPILYLSILALLSYLGGVISYITGLSITRIPKVRYAIENRLAKHIKNTRKWGGFLIVVGALFPIPFAITSIAAGFIRYEFKNYLLFGLLRFARFYLYAIAIFKVVQ